MILVLACGSLSAILNYNYTVHVHAPTDFVVTLSQFMYAKPYVHERKLAPSMIYITLVTHTNISAWDDPVVIGRRILHSASNSYKEKASIQ